jgi:transcriptional regulator with XRE-family HTH domain
MPKDHDVRALLAMNLKRARNNRGWSQLTLATELGMAPQFISNIELGKRWASPESIERLCQALHIAPYQLFVPVDAEVAEKDGVVALICDDIALRTNQLLDEVRAKYLG